MVPDPYSPTGLAQRCGQLTVALELLLEAVDELPIALDSWQELRVQGAQRALDECGSRAVTP
jgi:hypothetical protein